MKKIVYLGGDKFKYSSLSKLQSKARKYNIKIGNDSRLGHDVILGNNVEVGNFSILENNVKIGNNSILENNVKIGNNSILGSNSILKHGVTLESNVKVGNNSILENNVKVGNFSTLENNVKIENNVKVGNFLKVGSYTRVLAGTIIKGQIVLYNYYKYAASGYKDELTNKQVIQLGCHVRFLEEWEKNFDNNLKEFPFNSEERVERINVYELLKLFLNSKSKQ